MVEWIFLTMMIPSIMIIVVVVAVAVVLPDHDDDWYLDWCENFFPWMIIGWVIMVGGLVVGRKNWKLVNWLLLWLLLLLVLLLP